MVQSQPNRVSIKSAKCITKSPNVDYCLCTLPEEQIFSNYTFLGLLMELDFTDRGENVSFPGANKETNNSNVAERSA